MDAEDVPPELWMEIFEWLPLSSDLYNVMRTSKRFYNPAIRALHRNVVWKTPQGLAHNLPVWDANPGMNVATHSLELRISMLPPTICGYTVDLSGKSSLEFNDDFEDGADHIFFWRDTMGYHFGHCIYFASQSLHNAMITRIASFINLENLAFTDMVVTNAHFVMIHSLPRLRALRFEFCVFPYQGGSGYQALDHSTLPITELTLLNIRRRITELQPLANHVAVVDENMVHVLTLALARNLRTLRVDATADVFKHVFSGWRMVRRHGYAIPPRLERLYIQRKQLSQPRLPGELAFPDAALYSFLARATSITTYSTCHPPPPHHVFPPHTLPHLRRYSGPVESAVTLLRDRPIDALELLHCGHGVGDGSSALTSISRVTTNLQMLSLELLAWDNEIIHAVSSLFHDIRRLKIVYTLDRPTEVQFIVGSYSSNTDDFT